MIAIIIATGQNAAFHGLDESLPIPLLPLVDRPFIQHVVEYLVRQGLRRFELVLSHLPEKIERALGDGARWGCSFNYHLAPSESDAYRLARAIAANSGQEVILGSGASLPFFDLDEVAADTIIRHHGEWTGWGRFSSATAWFPNSLTHERLPATVREHEVDICLALKDGAALLAAQRSALEGSFSGLLIAAREAEPGVWISRNVVLHPSTIVTSPVYIGENSRIHAARIGPSVVIGANCIVDTHSTAVDSLITPGTYVGEALELDSVIVNRNRLVNVRLGTSFMASDTFLLGGLTAKSSGRPLQRIRDRLIALVLLLLLWPLFLVAWLFLSLARGERLVSREVLSLPSDDDPTTWRYRGLLHIPSAGSYGRAGELIREFLPGLISVVTGSVFLVGVQPRSRSEVESLPADWKSLYLKTKAGLITEARVNFGRNATEDELYTGEAFYSATESASHDAKLAALWLWSLVSGGGAASSVPVADQ